ncbi:hypothetical protein MXB_4040 [Myxobolus squamalis]|nr:hypothetical protein MXB_4040 [Myxobolus squamalis]
MKEANVNLKVTFIESRGFADQIDQTTSIIISAKNIVEYLEKQFDVFLSEETKINRCLSSFPDSRVHACVYMISPTGHALYPIDILSMKALHSKVNLIPIIGKADILTPSELKEFKARINKELAENNINVYRFPTDDRITATKNLEMNERMPFAVVSSAEEEVINKQLCRVRKYPWGTVVVDDDLHCEFMQFREMLLRSNLYDLILSTHNRFYEQYRISRFKKSGFPIDSEAENTRKKCSEIISFTDQQIREMSLKYDRDVKALDENFNALNFEMAKKYDTNLRELDNKRQELLENLHLVGSNLSRQLSAKSSDVYRNCPKSVKRTGSIQ